MLLITMHEWFGLTEQGRREYHERGLPLMVTETRHRGFVTRLPLAEALRRVHAYQVAYKQRYLSMALEFELLAVMTIDEMDEEAIDISRAVFVEKLAQRAEDVGR